MQVEKWGNDLAVRLPVSVIKTLKLQEGDEIEVSVAGAHRLEIFKSPTPMEQLSRIRKYRGRLPRYFKFDRLGANSRE